MTKKIASRYKALSRRKKGVIPTGTVHKITSLFPNVKQQTETLQFKNDNQVADILITQKENNGTFILCALDME